MSRSSVRSQASAEKKTEDSDKVMFMLINLSSLFLTIIIKRYIMKVHHIKTDTNLNSNTFNLKFVPYSVG